MITVEAERSNRSTGDRRRVRSAPVNASDVAVRVATAEDADSIIGVCSASLGWADPVFDAALFRWKHFENTFGRSLILVAEDESGLLAVRPMMRWRFIRGDEIVHAARAVDTATLPAARGRGLFRTLTSMALDVLRDQDVGFVFNTPNDQSRPGYLKMGWENTGPIAFGFALARPTRVAKVARSRAAAHKPSLPTPTLGVDVESGLATAELEAVGGRGMRTDHDVDTLRWRYAEGPVDYRWLPTQPGRGCIVRLRQRGPSRELVIAQHVGEPGDDTAWSAVRGAMREVDADYCLAPPGFGATRRVRRVGPTLTLREVCTSPSADDFAWTPGDIELF